MASGLNFKLYDPVAQLVATGGGAGGVGTITGGPGGNIANNTITSINIQDGTITGVDIANNTITNNNIQAGTITGGPGGNIANNTITSSNIQDGTITSTDILPGTITGGPGGNIANDTITSSNIQDGTITGTDILPGTITGGPGGNIANNTITSSNIQPGTITGGPGGNIANDTITSSNIQDGTITGTDIAPATVANSNIVPGPASTIKGTNSLSNVDDFIIGLGLSLSAGPSPTLSATGVVAPNAGNTQFGLVEFDPSGDLTETAINSGIANIKPLAVTNPKVNPGGASTLKGTNSLSNVDDIILGSGLSLTAGPSPTLSATGVVAPNAGNTQFGLVEFDPSGDLTETAINSGIANIKPLAVTNPKVNPGGASTLKGTNSLSNVDDIILGSGLSLTAGPSPTLSATGVVAPNAGNTQFGLVEFDPSGDLTETAINSGIANIKPLAVTNAKVNPGGASTLKGTNSLSNVDDIILGSGLSLTAGPSPTLSATGVVAPNAGNTQFGLVEFDPSGDLTETAINSGIANIKPLAVTNAKVNPGGASTLKGTSGGGVVSDITLGPGLSMPAGVLNLDPTNIQKAGNVQFGVVEFDPTGDLKESALNSGIAKIKQPALPPQVPTYNASFDALGNFIISTPPTTGTLSQPNNTPINAGNLRIQVNEVGPNKSLQVAVVNAGGGGSGINASGIGLKAATIAADENNGIPISATFVNLSSVPWVDKTTEEWFLYVNDGVDDAMYRVTCIFFPVNSAVSVEKLTST